jgi:L-fuculose-phosphate aldolase
VEPKIEETRKQLADIGRLLFSRKILDISGGNISARVDDVICISPRYAGSRYHWNLRTVQVLVVDLQGNLIDGEGEISRESRVHLKLINEFPEGRAVVHAHSQHVLAFCVLRKPMPPVLEFTLKFGTVPVADYAPGGMFSEELADNIASKMRGKGELIQKQAAVVLAPWHGQFVLGKSLLAAADAAERIDLNARTILFSRFLAGSAKAFDEEQQALERIASAYE